MSRPLSDYDSFEAGTQLPIPELMLVNSVCQEVAKTLLVEVGWPRLPEHGFVPDRGLARVDLGLRLLAPPAMTRWAGERCWWCFLAACCAVFLAHFLGR